MSHAASQTSGSPSPGGPLVVVGDVATDIVCAPNGPWRVGSDTDAAIEVRAGGSAANTAAWAASSLDSAAGTVSAVDSAARTESAAATHGPLTDVVFVGRVGSDDASWHRRVLTDVGVDAQLVVDGTVATTRLVALIDGVSGERTMLTDRGAGIRLAPADIDATLIATATWVHLSGYLLFAVSPQATFRHIVGICREAGVPWSVDPASAGYLADLGIDTARHLLQGASIGFPNAEEARLLAGFARDGQIEAVACALTKLWGTVVVKLGSKGAIVARDGSIIGRADSLTVAVVVDAVGAGDAFAGGWLAAMLGGGSDTDCLTSALRTAAAALGVIGGRPSGPLPWRA